MRVMTQPEPGSRWRPPLALIVFPLVGPIAIVLVIGLPLAVLGLFALGPGGVLYYFVLMTWWAPALYLLLAAPYFLAGILIAVAASVFKRFSLVTSIIATEVAFCGYLAFCYLAFGSVAIFGFDFANMASMLQSPSSAVVILAGAWASWFVMRRLGQSAAPVVQSSRWERPAAFGAALLGAGALAAMLAQGARLPHVAWKDCSEGGWHERLRGCTVIIQRADREPLDRRVTAYVRRGEAYEEVRQDFTSAIADYTEASRLDATSARAYARRGLAYARQGAHDRVIPDIDAALKLDPDVLGEGSYRLFRARAVAHFRRGAFDSAIADHTEEIRLTPRFADGYLGRALVHLARKDTDSAVADLTEAVRIEPYRPAGYIERGSIYLARGDAERALADFDEAIRRAPTNPFTAPAHRRRGEILEQRGDMAGALAAYEKAVELNPADKAARSARDRLHANRPKP
jgi:tetratricopeptide (TPR) repeat protein